ncbi:hypothetical protein KIN20_004755 [Parelaphostrongylus tenuis]|uniref:Uncharacterized protein n=1 Tax=Parelaphostrongylus tenuis TaxID=148309 RepID=A0AAD5QJK3_PARTN|nr:hypothetical protein KIN20_004755 [Parelaphostrongylus tenuis]
MGNTNANYVIKATPISQCYFGTNKKTKLSHFISVNKRKEPSRALQFSQEE